MEGSASTVGSKGAAGASTEGSEGIATPWGLPDPPHVGVGGVANHVVPPPPAHDCAGGGEAGPIGQQGGNPDSPTGPGGRLHQRGSAGTTLGVWHSLRWLVETTSSQSPIRKVKVCRLHCRMA